MPVHKLRTSERKFAQNLSSGVLAAALFWAALLLLTNPVRAEEVHRVFVVVPALGQEAGAAPVEQMVQSLKGQREKYKLASGVLPILRFQADHPRHQEMLHQLGVTQSTHIRVLLCRRGEDGWPEALSGLFEGPDAAVAAMRQVVGLPPLASKPAQEAGEQHEPGQKATGPSAASPAVHSLTEVGLLLAYKQDDSAEKDKITNFLSELGRYWTQRYGRVSPVPYPLGNYNLSDPQTAERVMAAFPALAKSKSPMVCLCLYEQGRPRRVLEIYDDLDLPATLVRLISAARGKHLAATVELPSASSDPAPASDQVTLSEKVEEKILLARLHETSRLLWSQAQDGDKGENRVTRRVLLRIAQLTEPGKNRTPEEKQALRDAVEDVQAEPLLLKEGSELLTVQQQFLETAHTLWPDLDSE